MKDEGMIRTFICIELPEPLKVLIHQVQTQLKTLSGSVSWVKAENVHLTLKFLGGVPEPQLPELIDAVDQMAMRYSPFTLIPEGHGVFPNAKSPRVFWFGIRDESGRLQSLQAALETGLEKLGFVRDNRPFKPHLTIGRVRPYRKPKELIPAFLALTFSADPFLVDHITVMRSDLKPTGAHYTPLRVISLRGQP